MQIVEYYYKNTPSAENKTTMLSMKDLSEF
jgi:hypothetical protein